MAKTKGEDGSKLYKYPISPSIPSSKDEKKKKKGDVLRRQKKILFFFFTVTTQPRLKKRQNRDKVRDSMQH